MQERFGHCRFVDTVHSSVETKPSSLEGHLYESIWRHPVARDEVLSESFELEGLAVILTDQVANPPLGKADASAHGRSQIPLQLLGGRINLGKWWC